jgi:serine/threonine-protein kinase
VSAATEAKVRDLGRYRLVAELAHGGMGVVYLALMSGPGGFSKLCVVKVLRPAYAADPQFATMFLDEARLAARLSHPNVVQTNEAGVEGTSHFLAMEYLEGQPLHRVQARMAKQGEFPLRIQLRALAEVCAGLHYAHELTDLEGTPLAVVHRDVTPHNVFVTYDGQVKLVDFGIAKAMDSSQETRTGVLKGKVAYMAPEQAEGTGVDRRADVFAVGVMLFEAITGQRLWKGIAEISILHHLVSGKIPRVRDVLPSADPALDAMVGKALARKREDRFATAQELQIAIEDYLTKHGGMPALRELGTLVSKAFAEERARVKLAVDNQLRKLREVRAEAALDEEMLRLAPASASGSHSGVGALGAPSGRFAVGTAAHRPKSRDGMDKSGAVQAISRPPAAARGSRAPKDRSATTVRASRSKPFPWIGATLLVSLLTIGVVAFIAGYRKAARTGNAEAATAPPN